MITGVVGGITGLAGVVFAAFAFNSARAANTLSRASNAKADGANALAREANELSVAANDLSHEANTIAKRSEVRDTDRNDVAWDGDWTAPGVYRMTNKGRDDAYEVRAVIVVDEMEGVASAEHVEPGAFIDVEVPGAREAFEAEMRKLGAARLADQQSAGTMFHTSEVERMRMSLYYHRINERVVWKSPAGKHDSHTDEHRLSTLGDID